ncbi:uncharacterized protein cp110 isoform X2 [Cololabis saira]|uniref:uncharacterized protein cp110 isoform X2 n=1 Tax=Cololabis saira TaxID=129043 RepID=UPI002AD3CF8B|nr:uncharacterized protein cp110 isoform X2 [Cololabis saira]
MEDYGRFVQRCVSQLKSLTEGEPRPPSAPSLIRFWGRPILPPLLSGKQREEMRQLRDEVQKMSVSMEVKDDPRMAYVQTILHSVQLRKTPTLEELLQEAEIKADSSHHSSSVRSESHCRPFDGTKESLSLTPVGKLTNSLPPMTSTTYSAFCKSNLTPQQSYHDGGFTEPLDNQQDSQPCSFNGANQHLLSSGYVTSENVENITTVSGGIDSETESRAFGSSDDVHNTDGVFLHNTSKIIHTMPDIISHPPIDGEELERSGLESSFSSDLIRVRNIFCPSFHNYSVNHYQHDTENENNIPFSSTYDPVNGGNKDRNEGQTTELHIQLNPSEAEAEDNQVNKEETKPSEEKTQSHPLSLQALLKKSQEYRRRQRMLRNQAKNTKIQERTQGQPRARTEEQSHSDKENDEFLYKGALTAEGKKAKERRGIFIPSVETSPPKSQDNEKMIESEVTGKKTNGIIESTDVLEDENNKDLTSAKEKTLKNNKLNSSQEAITKPQQINAFVQQEPLSSETSLVQEAFYGTTCFKTPCTEGGKYHSVPTPTFSRSPVPCKSKGRVKLGRCVEGTETSVGEFVVCNLAEDNVEEVNLAHQNSHTAPPITLNLLVEEDVTNVVAKSSLHIDQLESNLSSLKVLISDLESTVKENLDRHCQVGNNVQSESSFKSIKRSEQLHNNQHLELGRYAHFQVWEEKQRIDDDDHYSDMKAGEQSGTFPFLNLTNIHDHSGPQSHTNEADDDDVLTDKESRTETVGLSQSKLVKSSNPERGKEKEMDKEESIKHSQSGNCIRQKLPGKSILSVAQQMHIPNIFRNIPMEKGTPCITSVLSDNGNHLVEGEREMDLDGHDSMHSPSLNRSYDVETPSDLWLQEDWGSDPHSQSCLSQDKYLTPESGKEDQEGQSKVKRRLLMHVTEDVRAESLDTSRGVTSGVRPNSSTPRAALRWSEGRDDQRNKQEQVKRAHAEQVRALQDEHRKQQEELLQALAVRYRFLQNMSFPCSMSSSCPGDTVTFSTLSQPLGPCSQHYRPLLAAAVKGFLTRRLLRTERVAQLVRTIRDTQQFLRAFQQPSVGRGEFCSRQDVLLQDRVLLQLRAGRYEFHDIFFSLSAGEQMQLISWDRELDRERELKRQNGCPRGKTSLSAATQKSLERKRGMMIQKKTAERHMAQVLMRTGQKSEFSVEKQQQIKRRKFRANPERVLRSACSSRPL